MSRSGRRRASIGLVTVLAGLSATPTALAHTGTTHAGTPHWALLGLLVLGIAILLGGRVGVSRSRLSPRLGALVILSGVVVAGIGAVGLVEIQVVSSVGPTLNHLYPYASLAIGSTLMVGGLFVTARYWPDRPRYAALGGLLGVWVLYPNVLPNDGITNPLGYVIVVSLPLVVLYVLRRDANAVIASAFERRFSRIVGVATAVITTVIIGFSAGTLTVNPDSGINAPTEAFVTTIPVADPLVSWPAVEFFYPAIPFAGMISVGTAILFSVLGGLIGVNAAVIVDQWQSGVDLSLRGSLLGSISSTGATACCCCAPAMYGVISAVFGTAASPVYWAFMDTSSPLSSLFLSATVLLLVAGLVGAASGPPETGEEVTRTVSL